MRTNKGLYLEIRICIQVLRVLIFEKSKVPITMYKPWNTKNSTNCDVKPLSSIN